ncbi:hypothetical protein PHLGIDRAFT_123544 [Phlebiopsis gigantea 11061_1 CR5-6]|uniref:Uncharacterized protein n=1 Tax=Phlebiopsis gigantea (strain 11061_1 CR5-6) TaxID=745531 RepID=A0A0C3RYG7_PHLG1|nr:hypothetical protein PHLGIDRAFT_123544 [Phlebiopsis gigantea 11061_1 CR5-6]
MGNLSSMLIPTSASGRYRLAARLKGHSDAIHCLALSDDTVYLASGGSDGIRFWNIKTCAEIPAPYHSRLREPVTRILWLPQRDGFAQMLAYGTALGYLVLVQKVPHEERFDEKFARRLGAGGEITSIAAGPADHNGVRLATASRDQICQVWTFDRGSQLHNIWSVQMDGTVPIALSFTNSFSNDVCAFGIWDGVLTVLSGKDGSVISTRQVTDGVIGWAAVDTRQSLLAFDNVTDGFSLHRMDTLECTRTFPTGTPVKHRSKQVEFGEGGEVVVGGSDHGVAYVFDRATGVQLDVLRHAQKGMLQAIATSYSDFGLSTVATATTNCGNNNSICVWTHKGMGQGGTGRGGISRGRAVSSPASRAWSAATVAYEILAKVFNLAILIAFLIVLGQHLVPTMPHTIKLPDTVYNILPALKPQSIYTTAYAHPAAPATQTDVASEATGEAQTSPVTTRLWSGPVSQKRDLEPPVFVYPPADDRGHPEAAVDTKNEIRPQTTDFVLIDLASSPKRWADAGESSITEE